MPIVDSTLGTYIKDKKPTRICRWRECPLAGSGFEDVKLKACARCNFVRYCSKECQKNDWPTHKKGCRVPQFVDVRSWMGAYRWLVKWAVMEALQVYTNPMKIVNQCLVINVLAVERVVGPLPSPFIIVNAHVSDMAEILPSSPENDIRASLAIKESGGLGQALVVFQCHMIGGQGVCLVERFELHEPPLSASKAEGYEHFTQWEGVLKGVANGTLAVSDISHRLGD